MVHTVAVALVVAVLAGLIAPARLAAESAPRPTLRSGGTVRWSGGPLVGTAMDRFVGTGGSVCESASSCERFDLDVRVRRVDGTLPAVRISIYMDLPSQPYVYVVFPDGRPDARMGVAFDCYGIPQPCYGSTRMTVTNPPSGRWRIYVSCEACLPTMYSAEATAPLPPKAAPCRPAHAHRAGGVRTHASMRPAACASRIGYASKSPMIATDRANRLFVYPALDNGGRVARSLDRGRTWQAVSAYPTGFPSNALPTDPFLYIDEKTGRLFQADLLGAKCQAIAFSDDAGGSWRTSVAGCSEFDFQTVFAGTPVSSTTTGYPNVVYTCAVNTVATIFAGFSTTCEKSLDGGMTWVPTGGPAWFDTPGTQCNAGHGPGVAAPDGSIYLPRGGCGFPELAISRDEGMTWRLVRVSNIGMLLNSYGWYESKATVDVDRLGNLYFVWTARNRLPHLSISRNGGRTWSRPIVVAAPRVRETSLSTVAVGAPGKIAVAYMGSTNSKGPPFNENEVCVTALPECFEDTRNSDSYQPLDMGEAGYQGTTWNGYITVSANVLSSRPVFYSAPVNAPSDPLVRGSCSIRCRANGDRIDIAIGPDGLPWASFVDTCTGRCPTGTESEGQEGLAASVIGGPKLR